MRIGQMGQWMLLCGVAAMVPGSRAAAATAAVMTITGTAQGVVKGDVARGGVAAADEIQLINVVRSSGVDAATGLASGKGMGQQRTITVTKVYGPNSQELEQLAAENQLLREVAIVFKGNAAGKVSGATGLGRSKAAQKLVLKNAQITKIVQTRNVQEISLTYQAIEVTYVSGGTTAADDWETP